MPPSNHSPHASHRPAPPSAVVGRVVGPLLRRRGQWRNLMIGVLVAGLWTAFGGTSARAQPPTVADPAAAPAAAPATAAASTIDALDQAALQETFRLLRTNYIQRDAMTLEELNRAALAGLLARLDFGAEIVPLAPTSSSPDPAAAPPTVISEQLADTIGYVRPTAYSLDVMPAFDAALASLPQGSTTTLILDLRTPGPPAEFAVAAQMLERFLPEGQPLFSVEKTNDPAPRHFRSTGPPRWNGPLLLLIDDDCTNAAETIAAVLQRTLHTPLIGSPTRGRTMQYETAPLSATHGLRFASAEMRLPDGTSLFRKGLAPAFIVTGVSGAKADVFARQGQEGVKQFITHWQRPRFNEAALVAGTAPELPYQVAQSARQVSPYDSPPLQDRPLQVAVDVLIARLALK